MNRPFCLVLSVLALFGFGLFPVRLPAQANQQPDITLPVPAPDTTLGTSVGFAPTVSDPDVGAGLMELEIDISDLDGAGPLSVANGDYGRFSWGLGTNVTSDVGLATLLQTNNALSSFTYIPRVGYAGVARLVFEIDDQGNTGTGGVLSRTRFIDIDVCAPSELGTAACATNNQPDITLPGSISTPAGQSVSIDPVISDVDVGPGLMELAIDMSDLDGVGGLSVIDGDYGRFSWPFGVSVTSDVEIRTLAQLNSALTSFSYTPAVGFTGLARIVFEIDDQGNSGNALTVLSRTRFIDITVLPTGTLRFANGCTLSVGEGGSVAISVERINGNGGAASVQIQAQAGTAQSPADFTFAATQVSWTHGQSGLRTVNVPIVADGIQEPTESLTMLMANSSGLVIGAPSTKTVFIQNVPVAQFVFSDGLEGNCGN
ncbi:MAG: hypothetical protein IPK97_12470 [Ahniella sp.]|nr:hypothetical protein [Ahniella sp.]